MSEQDVAISFKVGPQEGNFIVGHVYRLRIGSGVDAKTYELRCTGADQETRLVTFNVPGAQAAEMGLWVSAWRGVSIEGQAGE